MLSMLSMLCMMCMRARPPARQRLCGLQPRMPAHPVSVRVLQAWAWPP
jgi:hypothetical protein